MSNPKSNNAKYVQHGSILSRLIRRRSSQSSDSSVEIPTEVTRNQSYVKNGTQLVRPGLRAPCIANRHSENNFNKSMTELSARYHEIFAKKPVRVKSLPNLIDIEKELRRPHFLTNQDCSTSFARRKSSPQQYPSQEFISQSTAPQRSASRSSVPQQFVSRSSVPQQFVSRSSVPQQFVSRSSVPQQFVSRSSVPQQFVSRSSVPQQFVSRSSVPQQFVSRSSVPQQFGSRQSLSQQFGPRPSVPQRFGPRPSVPPQFGSRPSVPPQFGSRPSVPPQFGPRPSVPPQFGPRPSVPPQFGPRPSVPPQFGPRPSVPPQFGPRPSVPQQFGPRPSVPQQFGPRPSVPQQFAPQPSVPQRLASQPSTPQQFVPQAFELQERLHKLRNHNLFTDHLSSNFMPNNSTTSLPCTLFEQPTITETSHQPCISQFNTGKRFINAQTSVGQCSSALYSVTEVSVSHAPIFHPLAKSKSNNLDEKPIFSSMPELPPTNNTWNLSKPRDFPKPKSVVIPPSKSISRARSITISKLLPIHRTKLLPSTLAKPESQLKVRKRSVSMTAPGEVN